MSHIYRLGDAVELKNPLPGEPRGPWKVLGVKLNRAPPSYNLLHQGAGRAKKIVADEGELVSYRRNQKVSPQQSTD